MNILIIGGGGREHALAWKAAQSPQVRKVYVAPGNAGTAREQKCENVPIGAEDIAGLSHFASQAQVDLTIVGPEAPLVAGIVDAFVTQGQRILGPRKDAAVLEGSKTFAKEFLARHDIPSASYGSFTDIEQALAFLREHGAPIVVKADGLAAGKGVVIARELAEAEAAVRNMLAGNAFGEAGHRVVIEEYLEGEEASFIVLADGSEVLPMASSQDHKARNEGDTGPNTGGMGAYSPAPVVTPELHERIMEEVVLPTVQGMAEEGRPYTGFLYAGLMVTPDGTPKVLEFNCRFGDPETQPIMMRLESDLIDLGLAAVEGRLEEVGAAWDPRPALGVVLAAQDYPAGSSRGAVIEGLNGIDAETVKVFHAGTKLDGKRIVTNGGRVLCVTALGKDLAEARARAYEAAETIRFEGVYYRKDIGYRALAR